MKERYGLFHKERLHISEEISGIFYIYLFLKVGATERTLSLTVLQSNSMKVDNLFKKKKNVS
jgi:hypothetical protein